MSVAEGQSLPLDVVLRAPLAEFELNVQLRTAARSVGLFGPSGAGKTSILEAVAGWRNPRAGHVRVGDLTLFDAERAIDVLLERRAIGYVPQEALLFPHWNVRRNIECAAKNSAEFNARVVAALALAPLLERFPATLSGGERRRVALARALCAAPKLLLLDEPLAALDRALRARVLSDILRVRAEFDVPLILVSHDPTEIITACEEVFVIERGRVVSHGVPAAVLRARASLSEAFENVLVGTVRESDGSTASIDVGADVTVHAVAAGVAAGERIWIGLEAEDVLVAGEAPQRISARNVLRAAVAEVFEDKSGRLRVLFALAPGESAPRLSADLTRAAATELALERGRAVHLVFKASSCHVVARAG